MLVILYLKCSISFANGSNAFELNAFSVLNWLEFKKNKAQSFPIVDKTL